MIKYELRCDSDHAFEAWFRDSATCDEQLSCGEVLCPHCASSSVSKALMAPAISKSAISTKEAAEPSRQQILAFAQHLQKLREYRRYVEQNCENVGSEFPEEARRIHYGEVEHRNIFGEADLEEAKALLEEGIDIFPVPDPFREDA